MPLYAFGSNGSGQLALTHKEDVSIPTKCHFETPPPPDDTILRIVAGGNHTLLLTENGYVYAAGCNVDGRCGPTPAQIESALDDSVHKKRQDTESLEADGKGDLLRFRRVILPDTVSGSTVERFRHISAAWEGSMLVGSVRRDISGSTTTAPTQGEHFEDRIFVLGSSPRGELGLGAGFPSSVRPGTTIPSFPPPNTEITALASGMAHSVAVLSNGDVYGWGAARKGQLGDLVKSAKIVWAPVKIEGIPFFARGATCGREFTVVFGEKGKGEFTVLGEKGNRWGVLDVPAQLGGGRPFVDIGASWHGVYVHVQTAVLKSDGEDGRDSPGSGSDTGPGPLVAWGRNDRGQLPPLDLPPVARLAVGSEHVVALLENGSVAAFGWGEHGNCGPVTDSMGNVFGLYQLVSLPESVTAGEKVVGVGAGCATSWLIVK